MAAFPVPVLCLLESVDAIKKGQKRIALRDPNIEGNPVLAVMDVNAIEEVSDTQMELMTEKVYGTTDEEHPGVAAFNNQGRFAVSGPIKVLNFSYFQTDFPDTFRTAVEIRNEIRERGWNTIVSSRPVIRCTGPMRSCAKWLWRRLKQTRCSPYAAG